MKVSEADPVKTFYPVAEPDLGALEERYLLEAFRSGWISSLGAFIQRFEAGFAEFCGVSHGVAVSNGTAALHLALASVGVAPGDEVIVPALTFVATAAVVRYVGAEPVFVDVESEIGTMDPRAVERAVSSRTRAIIPVHLYGHPVDMDPIMSIARRRRIKVIEDAAEAHGARYRGRVVGGIGDLGTFSFYGNKILTTGEGGIVVTNDAELVRRIRLLRDHAMDPTRRYWHPELGFNYRTTNLQAAVGCAQLERFTELCTRRAATLAAYREAFAGCRAVSINPARTWARPVPWLVCAVLEPGASEGTRDRVLVELKREGFDSRPYFIPLHRMPPYRSFRAVGASADGTPEADSLSARGFNLPSVRGIPAERIERVARVVINGLT